MSLLVNEDSCSNLASLDLYSDLLAVEDQNKKDSYNELQQKMSLVNEDSCSNLTSLDLYSDLLAVEDQNKQDSYNELAKKFEEAQEKISALETALVKEQDQRHSLSERNEVLQKNICALFQTANTELKRKNCEILSLSKKQRCLKKPRFRKHWGITGKRSADNQTRCLSPSLAAVSEYATRTTRVPLDQRLVEVSEPDDSLWTVDPANVNYGTSASHTDMSNHVSEMLAVIRALGSDSNSGTDQVLNTPQLVLEDQRHVKIRSDEWVPDLLEPGDRVGLLSSISRDKDPKGCSGSPTLRQNYMYTSREPEYMPCSSQNTIGAVEVSTRGKSSSDCNYARQRKERADLKRKVENDHSSEKDKKRQRLDSEQSSRSEAAKRLVERSKRDYFRRSVEPEFSGRISSKSRHRKNIESVICHPDRDDRGKNRKNMESFICDPDKDDEGKNSTPDSKRFGSRTDSPSESSHNRRNLKQLDSEGHPRGKYSSSEAKCRDIYRSKSDGPSGFHTKSNGQSNAEKHGMCISSNSPSVLLHKKTDTRGSDSEDQRKNKYASPDRDRCDSRRRSRMKSPFLSEAECGMDELPHPSNYSTLNMLKRKGPKAKKTTDESPQAAHFKVEVNSPCSSKSKLESTLLASPKNTERDDSLDALKLTIEYVTQKGNKYGCDNPRYMSSPVSLSHTDTADAPEGKKLNTVLAISDKPWASLFEKSDKLEVRDNSTALKENGLCEEQAMNVSITVDQSENVSGSVDNQTDVQAFTEKKVSQAHNDMTPRRKRHELRERKSHSKSRSYNEYCDNNAIDIVDGAGNDLDIVVTQRNDEASSWRLVDGNPESRKPEHDRKLEEMLTEVVANPDERISTGSDDQEGIASHSLTQTGSDKLQSVLVDEVDKTLLNMPRRALQELETIHAETNDQIQVALIEQKAISPADGARKMTDINCWSLRHLQKLENSKMLGDSETSNSVEQQNVENKLLHSDGHITNIEEVHSLIEIPSTKQTLGKLSNVETKNSQDDKIDHVASEKLVLSNEKHDNMDIGSRSLQLLQEERNRDSTKAVSSESILNSLEQSYVEHVEGIIDNIERHCTDAEVHSLIKNTKLDIDTVSSKQLEKLSTLKHLKNRKTDKKKGHIGHAQRSSQAGVNSNEKMCQSLVSNDGLKSVNDEECNDSSHKNQKSHSKLRSDDGLVATSNVENHHSKRQPKGTKDTKEKQLRLSTSNAQDSKINENISSKDVLIADKPSNSLKSIIAYDNVQQFTEHEIYVRIDKKQKTDRSKQSGNSSKNVDERSEGRVKKSSQHDKIYRKENFHGQSTSGSGRKGRHDSSKRRDIQIPKESEKKDKAKMRDKTKHDLKHKGLQNSDLDKSSEHIKDMSGAVEKVRPSHRKEYEQKSRRKEHTDGRKEKERNAKTLTVVYPEHFSKPDNNQELSDLSDIEDIVLMDPDDVRSPYKIQPIRNLDALTPLKGAVSSESAEQESVFLSAEVSGKLTFAGKDVSSQNAFENSVHDVSTGKNSSNEKQVNNSCRTTNGGCASSYSQYGADTETRRSHVSEEGLLQLKNIQFMEETNPQEFNSPSSSYSQHVSDTETPRSHVSEEGMLQLKDSHFMEETNAQEFNSSSCLGAAQSFEKSVLMRKGQTYNEDKKLSSTEVCLSKTGQNQNESVRKRPKLSSLDGDNPEVTEVQDDQNRVKDKACLKHDIYSHDTSSTEVCMQGKSDAHNVFEKHEMMEQNVQHGTVHNNELRKDFSREGHDDSSISQKPCEKKLCNTDEADVLNVIEQRRNPCGEIETSENIMGEHDNTHSLEAGDKCLQVRVPLEGESCKTPQKQKQDLTSRPQPVSSLLESLTKIITTPLATPEKRKEFQAQRKIEEMKIWSLGKIDFSAESRFKDPSYCDQSLSRHTRESRRSFDGGRRSREKKRPERSKYRDFQEAKKEETEKKRKASVESKKHEKGPSDVCYSEVEKLECTYTMINPCEAYRPECSDKSNSGLLKSYPDIIGQMSRTDDSEQRMVQTGRRQLEETGCHPVTSVDYQLEFSKDDPIVSDTNSGLDHRHWQTSRRLLSEETGRGHLASDDNPSEFQNYDKDTSLPIIMNPVINDISVKGYLSGMFSDESGTSESSQRLVIDTDVDTQDSDLSIETNSLSMEQREGIEQGVCMKNVRSRVSRFVDRTRQEKTLSPLALEDKGRLETMSVGICPEKVENKVIEGEGNIVCQNGHTVNMDITDHHDRQTDERDVGNLPVKDMNCVNDEKQKKYKCQEDQILDHMHHRETVCSVDCFKQPGTSSSQNIESFNPGSDREKEKNYLDMRNNEKHKSVNNAVCEISVDINEKGNKMDGCEADIETNDHVSFQLKCDMVKEDSDSSSSDTEGDRGSDAIKSDTDSDLDGSSDEDSDSSDGSNDSECSYTSSDVDKDGDNNSLISDEIELETVDNKSDADQINEQSKESCSDSTLGLSNAGASIHNEVHFQGDVGLDIVGDKIKKPKDTINQNESKCFEKDDQHTVKIRKESFVDPLKFFPDENSIMSIGNMSGSNRESDGEVSDSHVTSNQCNSEEELGDSHVTSNHCNSDEEHGDVHVVGNTDVKLRDSHVTSNQCNSEMKLRDSHVTSNQCNSDMKLRDNHVTGNQCNSDGKLSDHGDSSDRELSDSPGNHCNSDGGFQDLIDKKKAVFNDLGGKKSLQHVLIENNMDKEPDLKNDNKITIDTKETIEHTLNDADRNKFEMETKEDETKDMFESKHETIITLNDDESWMMSISTDSGSSGEQKSTLDESLALEISFDAAAHTENDDSVIVIKSGESDLSGRNEDEDLPSSESCEITQLEEVKRKLSEKLETLEEGELSNDSEEDMDTEKQEKDNFRSKGNSSTFVDKQDNVLSCKKTREYLVTLAMCGGRQDKDQNSKSDHKDLEQDRDSYRDRSSSSKEKDRCSERQISQSYLRKNGKGRKQEMQESRDSRSGNRTDFEGREKRKLEDRCSYSDERRNSKSYSENMDKVREHDILSYRRRDGDRDSLHKNSSNKDRERTKSKQETRLESPPSSRHRTRNLDTWKENIKTVKDDKRMRLDTSSKPVESESKISSDRSKLNNKQSGRRGTTYERTMGKKDDHSSKATDQESRDLGKRSKVNERGKEYSYRETHNIHQSETERKQDTGSSTKEKEKSRSKSRESSTFLEIERTVSNAGNRAEKLQDYRYEHDKLEREMDKKRSNSRERSSTSRNKELSCGKERVSSRSIRDDVSSKTHRHKCDEKRRKESRKK